MPSIAKQEPGTYVPRQLGHGSIRRSMSPSPHLRTSFGRPLGSWTRQLIRMLQCQAEAAPPRNACKLEDVQDVFEQTNQPPFPSWQQAQISWPSFPWQLVLQQPWPFSSCCLSSVAPATRQGPCWTLWSSWDQPSTVSGSAPCWAHLLLLRSERSSSFHHHFLADSLKVRLCVRHCGATKEDNKDLKYSI